MSLHHRPSPAACLRAGMLVVATLCAFAAFVALRTSSQPASAIAPCVPWSNTAEELDLLAQLQAWRNANVPGSKQLVRSAPLNAASAGYAQLLATTGGSGHEADGSTMWARAQNCGFTSNGSVAAGGEGLGRGATASAALAMMTAHPGSGVYMPAGDCVGVAKAGSGASAVWIVMIMIRLDGNCPQAVTGAPPTSTPTTFVLPTNTSTATATSTSTPLPTSTPAPTATPTPVRYTAYVPGVCAGCAGDEQPEP